LAGYILAGNILASNILAHSPLPLYQLFLSIFKQNVTLNKQVVKNGSGGKAVDKQLSKCFF
jgi:hypothetical protein